MPRTELPGDVVQWGDGHKQLSAASCCAACRAKAGCNSWVWCSHAHECGASHLDCWLKKRPQPWEDADLLTGRSTKWTSGILGAKPAALGVSSRMEGPCDFALLMADGLVRFRLRPEATSAFTYVKALVAELEAQPGETVPTAPAVGGIVRDGLRFYRAEPVPPHWGSLDWPDTWAGGRWGPPYSLLQGHLRPSTSRVKPAAADHGPGARPVIRRGMVAWAGGQGGPDFFVALAQHPEWGNGHTVFAEVFPEDMAVIDAVMRRPLVVKNWGSINATELVTPMPYRILGPVGVRAWEAQHPREG
jgi:hypothetical protein